jgi:hypothetical protein
MTIEGVKIVQNFVTSFMDAPKYREVSADATKHVPFFSHKKKVGRQSRVNFINILRVAKDSQYVSLSCTFKIFAQKAAPRTLMKLTPSLH